MSLMLTQAERARSLTWPTFLMLVKPKLSIGESIPSFDENLYFKIYDDMLDQLMEADENKQLKVCSSQVERRDVYLTAKKATPSWKKVIVRKTMDVENDKVIQIKYIGDKDWGKTNEKIENGPLRVHTHMVYLNVESDMDAIMDYIIDPVAGCPSRNRVVNGNVCVRADDLIFTGTDDVLLSFAKELKKSFQIGSLDENEVMFCGQRILKQGATVTVHQNRCIEDLHEALIPKGQGYRFSCGAKSHRVSERPREVELATVQNTVPHQLSPLSMCLSIGKCYHPRCEGSE